MRVAVCIAGQPRSYKVCTRNILDVFLPETNDIQVDFHIHTWGRDRGRSDCRSRIYSVSTLKKELRESFNPQSLEVDQDWREIWDPQTYSVARCFELMCNFEDLHKFTYDWVFFTRLDWFRGEVLNGKYLPLRVNYQTIRDTITLENHSTIRRPLTFYGGYEEGISHFDLEIEGFNYKVSDFSFSFSSKLARVWKDIYKEKRAFYKLGYDFPIVEHWWAVFCAIHNISVVQGHEQLNPGFPVRTLLELRPDLDIYSTEGLYQYCGDHWYLTLENLQKAFPVEKKN